MKKLFELTTLKIKRDDIKRSVFLLEKEGIRVYSDMKLVFDFKNFILGFMVGAILIAIMI